jgi:hypothetical protein
MEGDVGAGGGSLPCPRTDRAGGVRGVVADQAGEPGRLPRHMAAGMDVRHDLFRRARQGLPARMDAGQEVEIILAVDGLARLRAEIVGCDDAVAGITHCRQERFGACRNFGVGDDRAAADEGPRLVARVLGGVDDLHGARPFPARTIRR